MQQFGQLLSFINGLLKPYRIIPVYGLLILLMLNVNFMHAQSYDPSKAIHDLKEGILMVRIPTSRPKIDTLQAMLKKSTDKTAKLSLQHQLDEAIQERDSLLSDYTAAFRKVYNFSKTGYFFDYESHNLRTAHFYHMDGTPISSQEIGSLPVFYLYFERTEESHIDALVVYDTEGHKIGPPFPNNFIRSGINFLFIKISEKSFPAWRIGKINKQFQKYWLSVSRV